MEKRRRSILPAVDPVEVWIHPPSGGGHLRLEPVEAGSIWWRCDWIWWRSGGMVDASLEVGGAVMGWVLGGLAW